MRKILNGRLSESVKSKMMNDSRSQSIPTVWVIVISHILITNPKNSRIMLNLVGIQDILRVKRRDVILCHLR